MPTSHRRILRQNPARLTLALMSSATAILAAETAHASTSPAADPRHQRHGHGHSGGIRQCSGQQRRRGRGDGSSSLRRHPKSPACRHRAQQGGHCQPRGRQSDRHPVRRTVGPVVHRLQSAGRSYSVRGIQGTGNYFAEAPGGPTTIPSAPPLRHGLDPDSQRAAGNTVWPLQHCRRRPLRTLTTAARLNERFRRLQDGRSGT